ncbi:Alpha-(1,6)-fucosyltransferase [Chamberlinius hualienensis]
MNLMRRIKRRMKLNISLGRAIVVLVAVWLLAIFFLTRPLLYSGENTDQIAKQLGKAMSQLELLKMQNEEFRTLLADFRQIGIEGGPCSDRAYIELQAKLDRANKLVQRSDTFVVTDKKEANTQQYVSQSEEIYTPHKEVEKLQRRIYRGVKELWYYVSAELKKLKKLSGEDKIHNQIDEILEDGAEHRRTIFVDLYNLSRANGRYNWVRREIKDLEGIVERRITALQNPADCDTAKKVVCNLNKGCGYGCQLHHAVYCLMVAYGTQRTLILKSQGWRYSRDGWESVYLPVSNSCLSDYGVSQSSWPPKDETQVITLPIIDSMNPKPPFLPLAIPKDLSDRLIMVHGDPSVWWIAQFVKFLLRPQEPLAKYLRELTEKMDFKKPIVGIHVRRTDKVGTEAAYHSIEEYMDYVKDYYAYLELQQDVPVKRVYLASDDPSVLEDAKKKWDYDSSVSSRYSYESLKGVVGDIHLLAHTDYLVCTFSSQVCRVAYEIMQTLEPDPSANFQSLDDIYYFGGQLPHSQKVLYNHSPRHSDQFDMAKGDIVGLAGNHYDGFSRGINRRTKKEGLYPSFKADDIIPLFD